MIAKVKELRIRIDGLAQLVKDLENLHHLSIDVSSVPEGFDIQEFTENWYKGIHDPKFNNIYYQDCIKNNESKEIEKSYDSLILAKAWLGKVLQELGEETPYKNDGKRKNVEDIEKAADKDNNEGVANLLEWKEWNNKSHIEKVDWLREEIKNIITKVDPYSKNNTELILENTAFLGASLFNCHRHLIEARFWLRFELQRIKENEHN